jgi:hypothetical protein
MRQRSIHVPYGAAFAAQNQDPTITSTTPGGASLPADFLRPYRGHGNINLHEMSGNANYNSLQTTLDRRFHRGLLFSPYDANGNFVPANRNGFGTVNGARDPRIIQLVARLKF